MYYSERKKVNNGQAIAPVYHTDEDKDKMERQFHLNCANVLDGTIPRNDLDVCEWGLLGSEAYERKVYHKPEPEPETQTTEQEQGEGD